MSIYPTVGIGCVWPPHEVFNDLGFLPALNTFMLVSSGFSLTWGHRALISGVRAEVLMALQITLLWGIAFMSVQAYEYVTTPFGIYDSIFGSLFYILTGFHGMHVFVGIILLILALSRVVFNHFDRIRHWGFILAAWY